MHAINYNPDAETLLTVVTCHSGCHLLLGIVAILTDKLVALQRAKESHDQTESKLRMLTLSSLKCSAQIRPICAMCASPVSRGAFIGPPGRHRCCQCNKDGEKGEVYSLFVFVWSVSRGMSKKSRKTACFYILKMPLWAELGSFPIGLHLDRWPHRQRREYR